MRINFDVLVFVPFLLMCQLPFPRFSSLHLRQKTRKYIEVLQYSESITFTQCLKITDQKTNL